MTEAEILNQFRDAGVAALRGSPDAKPLAQRFHRTIAALPWQGPGGEPWGQVAFELVGSKLDLLDGSRAFEPAMMVGEVLAACVMAEPAYAAVLPRFLERPYPGPRLAALRACSKLCEYDPSIVDEKMLLALAARNDLTSGTLGYLGQVAGRLRGVDAGTALIERLAPGSADMRIVAAHAITYSAAMDPPFALLGAWAAWGPSKLKSAEPSRRQMLLLAALLDDTNQQVAKAAEQAAQVGRHAWPDFSSRLANLVMSVQGLPPPAHDRAGRQGPVVEFALAAPARIAQRQGMRSWSQEPLDLERAAAEAGRSLPRAIGAPRLFLSYRWGDELSEDTLIDHYAGMLFGRGYDLVFDRDPRHFAAPRSADEVLQQMYECTHFVPLVTEPLRRYLARPRPGPPSALDQEWALARRLARRQVGLQWVSLWLHGPALPRALARRAYVDLREGRAALDAAFPDCRFEVRAFDASGALLRRMPVLDRIALFKAYERASALRRCARCEVHDITPRAALSAQAGSNAPAA